MGMNSLNKKRGFTVIEILITVAVMGIVFASIMGVVALSIKVSRLNNEAFEANLLMRETFEEVRNFRDNTEWSNNGLDSLSTGTVYHPERTDDGWIMVSGSETKGAFSRSVILEEVMRDSNDDIVDSGGVVDPDTCKVNVTVEWIERDRSIQASSYLTNWREQ